MFKMIRDTWIYLRDIGIQCFLNFWDICQIYFRDMGYVFKTIKEMWDTGTPFQGLTGEMPHSVACGISSWSVTFVKVAKI